MKKPFISLKSNADKLRLVLAIVLCASASLLFFMPDTVVPVFSDGTGKGGISGLFNLVDGWV